LFCYFVRLFFCGFWGRLAAGGGGGGGAATGFWRMGQRVSITFFCYVLCHGVCVYVSHRMPSLCPQLEKEVYASRMVNVGSMRFMGC